MTAAFDATGAVQASGADQRFSDALSGGDGTGDPSVLMPVLDVYPDALSASMPVDLIPVLPPTVLQTTGVRATPVTAGSAGRAPAARPAQRQPAQRQPAQRQPAQRQPVARQAVPARPVRPGQPAAYSTQQRPQASKPAAQLGTMTAADFGAMFRNLRSGQSEQLDRSSFQATHPQSMGSVAPSAVAPAAPMASQYSTRGQARNTNRDLAQERRRASSTPPRRKSSVGAVLVFIFVIVFASGLGQKAIDLFNELFNR